MKPATQEEKEMVWQMFNHEVDMEFWTDREIAIFREMDKGVEQECEVEDAE